MSRWLVAIACLSGCADPLENAILEVDLELPPNTTPVEPLHAVVQAEPGPPDFLEPWAAEPASFTMERAPSAARFSVVSETAHAAIGIKVRFCEDLRCGLASDARAPEVHVRVEQPFHLREYSAIALALADIPPAFETLAVGKCEVRACTEDERPTYCDARDVHVCDQ
jgi:hypothetical protein